MSQICALIVFCSTEMLLVANSTPIVDLLSRLNSLRVNRERTASENNGSGPCYMRRKVGGRRRWRCARWEGAKRTVPTRREQKVSTRREEGGKRRKTTTYDFPTPESPISTTYIPQGGEERGGKGRREGQRVFVEKRERHMCRSALRWREETGVNLP